MGLTFALETIIFCISLTLLFLFDDMNPIFVIQDVNNIWMSVVAHNSMNRTDFSDVTVWSRDFSLK